MKKSEFVSAMAQYGLFVKDGGPNELIITDLNNVTYATVVDDKEYRFNADHAGQLTRAMFDTLMTYCSTPSEKRKDKPKLYRYEPFKDLYDIQNHVPRLVLALWDNEDGVKELTFMNVDKVVLYDYEPETSFTEYELIAMLGKNFNANCMSLIV